MKANQTSQTIPAATFIVETVPCFTDNLSYLIVEIDQRSAVGRTLVIDPGEAPPFFHRLKELEERYAKPFEISAVLTTHHHHDHTDGLIDLPEVPTWTSVRDQNRLPSAGGKGRPQALQAEKTYTWHELLGSAANPTAGFPPSHEAEFSILEIPGHTAGQIAICLKQANERHVFVGDTLFSFGCGRCLEGTPEELFHSLQKIKALPPESRLHFGHEYTKRNLEFWYEMLKQHPSDLNDLFDEASVDVLKQELASEGFTSRKAPTILEELRSNPFLKIKNATEFRRWRQYRNQF